MVMLRRIEEDSIRSLASAQAILDLAAAIKELVDNAIDANSTQISNKQIYHMPVPNLLITMIDVIFEHFGLEHFEVHDNGHGIPGEEFSKIGRRSYTSKIIHDTDLYSTESFGFRGEALHCLAALSDELVLTSRHVDEQSTIGFRTRLSKEQKETGLIERVTCNQGTTVAIKGLLITLPVRLAEWRRNFKRYFGKAVNYLQNYALAVPLVKIKVINDKQILFSTCGSGNLSKCYAEAFGGSDAKAKFRLVQNSSKDPHFDFEMHFALADRKNPDRQFIFINRRPCEIAKLFKQLNEASRNHGISGFPIFIVHLKTTELVDFNLTPDKRQVALRDQDKLIEEIVQSYSKELTKGAEIPKLPPSIVQSTIFSSESQAVSRPPSQTATVSSLSAPELETVCAVKCKPSTVELIPSVHNLADVKIEDDHALFLEKTEFGKMKVIGQYNCGFILAKSILPNGNCNIFIIDQHASDERYRFEALEKGLQFTTQSLLHPIELHLSIEDVLFIEEQANLLREYGFMVESSMSTKNEKLIRLQTTPHVAGVQLDRNG